MTTNCLQYLLGVSEKIINSCADEQTLRKYYALKDKILDKWSIQGSDVLNTFCTLQKENKKAESAFRNSLISNQTSGSKRQNIRQSMTKSQAKSTKMLQKGRIQTYTSKKSENTNEIQKVPQLIILTQIATILKNVEACPSILKTIRLTLHSQDEKTEGTITSIEESLKNIYYSHIKPLKSQIVQQQKSQTSKHQNWNGLIADNQWLIGKLQQLIHQNSTLRRMVGRKIY